MREILHKIKSFAFFQMKSSLLQSSHGQYTFRQTLMTKRVLSVVNLRFVIKENNGPYRLLTDSLFLHYLLNFYKYFKTHFVDGYSALRSGRHVQSMLTPVLHNVATHANIMLLDFVIEYKFIYEFIFSTRLFHTILIHTLYFYTLMHSYHNLAPMVMLWFTLCLLLVQS